MFEEAEVSSLTKDYLGRELSADEMVKILAVMLGWSNTPPWHVLERDLREKLRLLEDLRKGRNGSP